MAQRVFTKDTMLDLVVNIIPMGIMAFFIGLFVIWGPFSWDPLYSTLMLGIIGGSFVLLAILTYVSAIAIRGDEIDREEAEGASHDHGSPDAAAGNGDAAEDSETEPTAEGEDEGGLDHTLASSAADTESDADEAGGDDDGGDDDGGDDDGGDDDGDDDEYEEVF